MKYFVWPKGQVTAQNSDRKMRFYCDSCSVSYSHLLVPFCLRFVVEDLGFPFLEEVVAYFLVVVGEVEAYLLVVARCSFVVVEEVEAYSPVVAHYGPGFHGCCLLS